MIKEINMPMMAPLFGGSSSGPAWEDIPVAGPADIQSGRNVYIELNEDQTATKASAGKILQFIKEGYMPVLKIVDDDQVVWQCNTQFTETIRNGVVVLYGLKVGSVRCYAYPDALDKPFTTVERASGGHNVQ